MKYTIISFILLTSCSITKRNQTVTKNSLPQSDRFIQGNYSHHFSKMALVSHEKVYEFSETGECFSSGTPLGPDSHGNHPDYYGQYYIQNDTLHAYFFMHRSIVSIYNTKEYLTKDGLWCMTPVDTSKVDFYIQSNDSIIELPFRKGNVVFKLNQDSLSFLPIRTEAGKDLK